ncbi:MAG: nickel pincer cofactor biosynthesis protein LarC [Phycisphaerae bacterium]|nr:nickel pincer cofactor biosynthesis protein LarC [Phycisphaerae bacterium]
MSCAYFDCFCGAAGDMILAALVDAGCPVDVLRDVARRMKLPEISVEAETVQRKGLAATYLRVEIEENAKKTHRHLPDILQRIDGSGLPDVVRTQATRIFNRLAAAEAQVHGITPEHVHFHEVGAADAMLDIVGACAALHHLGVERVVCSPLPPGSGTVKCAHGVLPLPAPATAVLLKGVPLAQCDEPGELVTPTGAAILATLAEEFGPLPPLTVMATGVGAGTREGRTRANILRVFLMDEPDADTEHDLVTVLETQLDDTPGQVVAFTTERLLEAGALDAYVVPIIMKKGRPGQLLTVLCRPADVTRLEDILFAETRTFGIRRHERHRSKLCRRHDRVETPYGAVRIKVGERHGDELQGWPEYEDCAALARERGVALRVVQEAALAAWQTKRT